jgi:hypothetical protein
LRARWARNFGSNPFSLHMDGSGYTNLGRRAAFGASSLACGSRLPIESALWARSLAAFGGQLRGIPAHSCNLSTFTVRDSVRVFVARLYRPATNWRAVRRGRASWRYGAGSVMERASSGASCEVPVKSERLSAAQPCDVGTVDSTLQRSRGDGMEWAKLTSAPVNSRGVDLPWLRCLDRGCSPAEARTASRAASRLRAARMFLTRSGPMEWRCGLWWVATRVWTCSIVFISDLSLGGQISG